MTEPLPAPPIAPDADLSGFDFMPLHGDRLRASDTNSRATDAEFRAAINLWWAAWKQVPAASLPDDDVVLCKLADLGRDLKAWRKVKAVAMANFLKCSDGRLYHPFLAAEAAKAWELRLKARAKAKAGNDKRWGQKQGGEPVDNPSSCDPPATGKRSPKDSPSDSDASPKHSPEDRKGHRQDKTNPNTAFPVLEASGPAGPPAGGEIPTPNPEAPARILAECTRAKLEDPTAENAIVGRWISSGATPTQVATALAEARRYKPAGEPLEARYVNPIVERIVEADRRTRDQVEARVRRTQDGLAELRQAKADPMPDSVRAKIPRKPAGEPDEAAA